jgi:hypothetical protein
MVLDQAYRLSRHTCVGATAVRCKYYWLVKPAVLPEIICALAFHFVGSGPPHMIVRTLLYLSNNLTTLPE